MIKLAVLVTVCLVGSMAVSVTRVLDKPYYELENAEDLFRDFVKQYGKSYNRKEYSERLEIFKKSLRDINRRNAKYPDTVFAVNHFADFKPEELQQYRGFNYRWLKLSNEMIPKVTIIDSSIDPPAQLDWRDKGVVSHVKHQRECLSCSIFSAIGNIEGQYAIKHNKCLSFSEGQALDCFERQTCIRGGLPHLVMDDFSNSVGVMKEEDYPYHGRKNRMCHQDANKVVAHLKGSQLLNIPDEDTLLMNLAQIGPLAVGIADQDLQHYEGGISRPDACNNKIVNHAVLLVGYGEENGTKFWIIKNSWGADWGEQGYVRLLRGVNACQMGTSYTASAILA